MKRATQFCARRGVTAIVALSLAMSGTGTTAIAKEIGDVAVRAAVTQASAENTASEAVSVSSADELVAAAEAGKDVVLAADITMAAGQQIAKLAGTLDGFGHTITLTDTALAAEVSGTIQNLGVVSTGTIAASSGNLGSVALKLTGTIQNCWSTATLKYDGWDGEVAGLVGELAGGTVRNSLFAGTISAMMSGGIVGTSSSGTIASCVFTVGSGPASVGYGGLVKENCKKLSSADAQTDAALEVLNKDIPDTGYRWVLEGSYPVLADATAVEVNKKALQAAVDAAGQVDLSQYEDAEQQAFKDALAAATGVLGNEGATQGQVDSAVKALTGAQAALVKKKPTSSVAVPENAVHIASQDDLENKITSKADAYYVLDNDITISGFFFGGLAQLNGVFDGQGHTITFTKEAGAGAKLFTGIGTTGVVQNLNVTGTMVYESGNKLAQGPFGVKVQGAIINCSTSVAGDNIAGFARVLDGGVVSNCYSTANGTKVGGVLFAQVTGGKLVNTYWQEDLSDPAGLTGEGTARENSFPLALDEMKTMSFADMLNANRGEHGVTWGQGADGLPYFGESQDYDEVGDGDAVEDRYQVTFTDADGEECAVDRVLEVDADQVPASRIIGTLKLADVPAASTITWGTDDANRGNVAVNETTGELYVDAGGSSAVSGTVTATEHLANGATRTAATVVVRAKSRQIDDFQIWYDGKNVTGGEISVAGSEVSRLSIRAHYAGDAAGEYVPVSFTRFTFTGSDASVLYSNSYSASFYFKKAGTASISVKTRSWDAGEKTVTITSTPVAATKIDMGYAEDGKAVTLHGRNPLSDLGQAFLTDKARPQVTPDNATNRDNFTVTSSNPAVASYTTSGDIGYTAYAAGTTTFTATLPDTDAAGKQLSASVDVTYEYANPLKSVTAGESEVSVKAGSQTKLDLAFTGERDDEGYSVTEPGLTWTYSTDGVVSIDREVKGAWKHKDGAPDDGLYLASSDYTVTALKAGTVTCTGTPVDQTAGAKPVVITITVSGVADSPQTGEVAQAGLEGAAKYLDSVRTKDSYQYGQEWEVYTFLTAGREIPAEMLDRYVASVSAAADEWKASATEIERVGLALAAMGRDVSDVDGANLVQLLCDDVNLDGAYNKLVWALMLVNESGVEPAESSVWTRDRLVEAVAAGVGAASVDESNSRGGGVDLTAMALRALAPYRDDADVEAALERGLDWLRGKMNAGTCDFGSSEADAQVILALVALDMDPANPVYGFANDAFNVVTALAGYQIDGGGFAHLKGEGVNGMATVQALQAMCAYQKAAAGTVSWAAVGAVEQGTVDPVTPQPPASKDDGDDDGADDGSNSGSGNFLGGGSSVVPTVLSRKVAPVASAASGKAAEQKAPDQGDSPASMGESERVESATKKGATAVAAAGEAVDEARAVLPMLPAILGAVGVAGIAAAVVLYLKSRKQ